MPLLHFKKCLLIFKTVSKAPRLAAIWRAEALLEVSNNFMNERTSIISLEKKQKTKHECILKNIKKENIFLKPDF